MLSVKETLAVLAVALIVSIAEGQQTQSSGDIPLIPQVYNARGIKYRRAPYLFTRRYDVPRYQRVRVDYDDGFTERPLPYPIRKFGWLPPNRPNLRSDDDQDSTTTMDPRGGNFDEIDASPFGITGFGNN